MNTKDYNFLKSEIEQAEEKKLFYSNLGEDYINEYNFWTGYLNGIHLFWLQAKNDYKL